MTGNLLIKSVFLSTSLSNRVSIIINYRRGYEEDGQKGRLQINGLFYEAYRTMALKKMRQILAETMKNNGQIKRCYVVHRLGLVKAGEASILIATCSPGREDCSKETMNILNRVKQEVPVWKKVVYSDDPSLAGGPDESKMISEGQTASSSQPQTNWMMKSEAFWLKK